MKLGISFVVFCFYFTAYTNAISPEELETLITYSRDCRAETGATIEMVTMAVAGIFVDDPKLKSQFFCISKKLGFQTKEGDINMEPLKKRVKDILKDSEKTEDILKTCAVKKETPDETAYDSLKCFLDNGEINLLTA